MAKFAKPKPKPKSQLVIRESLRPGCTARHSYRELELIEMCGDPVQRKSLMKRVLLDYYRQAYWRGERGEYRIDYALGLLFIAAMDGAIDAVRYCIGEWPTNPADDHRDFFGYPVEHAIEPRDENSRAYRSLKRQIERDREDR